MGAVSKHPIAQPQLIPMKPVVLRKLALVVLLLALLAVSGCSGRTAPDSERVEPSATSFPTSLPVAKASTPTAVPVTPTVPKPTATFVPLITPSATPEGGALKVRVPRISVETAKEMADAGEAVLVDVRTRGTFEAAHIAGAISFPSDGIPDRYGELPTDKLIIYYCA